MTGLETALAPRDHQPGQDRQDHLRPHGRAHGHRAPARSWASTRSRSPRAAVADLTVFDADARPGPSPRTDFASHARTRFQGRRGSPGRATDVFVGGKRTLANGVVC
ncbi:MAG: hypothetical protein ACLTSX_14660 [Collinsella sp.]